MSDDPIQAEIQRIQTHRDRRAQSLGKTLPPLPSKGELEQLIADGVNQTKLLGAYSLSKPVFDKLLEIHGLEMPDRRKPAERPPDAEVPEDQEHLTKPERPLMIPHPPPSTADPFPKVTEVPQPRPPLQKLRERLSEQKLRRLVSEGRQPLDIATLYYCAEETVRALATEYGVTFPVERKAASAPAPTPTTPAQPSATTVPPAISLNVDCAEQGFGLFAILQSLAEVAASLGQRRLHLKVELSEARQ